MTASKILNNGGFYGCHCSKKKAAVKKLLFLADYLLLCMICIVAVKFRPLKMQFTTNTAQYLKQSLILVQHKRLFVSDVAVMVNSLEDF